MIKTVIFDLDGTLLNTIDDIADSLNIALEDSGFEKASVDEVKTYVGSGVKILIHNALRNYDHTDIQENHVLQVYQREYEERQLNKTTVYYGIDEVLAYLQKKEYNAVVLSNKPHDDVVNIVNHYFKEGTFALVVGKKKGVPIKPDPTALYDIMHDLHCHQEEVLYVGDGENDMEVALNANVKKVGCVYGYRSYDILSSYNPEYIIDNPLNIIDIIEEINNYHEEVVEYDDDDATQAANE